jgi:hypothetical protein
MLREFFGCLPHSAVIAFLIYLYVPPNGTDPSIAAIGWSVIAFLALCWLVPTIWYVWKARSSRVGQLVP